MSQCFAPLRALLDKNVISDEELDGMIKRAESFLGTDKDFSSMRNAMIKMLEEDRTRAAKFKMYEGMNVLKRIEREQREKNPVFDGRPWDALQAESIGGRSGMVKGGNRGIHDISAASARQILEPLHNELVDTHGLPYAESGELDEKVARELWEMRKGGKPGSTGSEMAQKIAKAYRAAYDRIRQLKEEAGYPVGYVDGYIAHQTHNPVKIRATDFDTWKNDILSSIDQEKTFGAGASEAEKAKYLDEMHDDIVHNRYGGEDVTTKIKKDGNKTQDRRAVVFKDGQSFYQYNQKYGDGNLYQTVYNTAQREARNIGNLTKYGSKPLEAFQEDIDRAKRYYASDEAKEKYGRDKANEILKTLNAKEPSLISGFKISAGLADQIGTELPAKLGFALQALQNVSKLGTAAFKKSTELAYSSALTSSLTGRNFLEMAAQTTKDFLSMGLPKSEAESTVQKQLMINYIRDVSAAQLTDRYGMGYSQNETLTKMNDLVYKWTGINAHTNRSRLATAANLARQLALEGDKKFADLNPTLQGNLKRYDIGHPEWEALRQSVGELGHDGSKAMISENIPKVDPAMAQKIMDENGIKGKTTGFLNTVQNKYLNLLQEVTEMSVLHSNVAAQNLMRGGINPNTWRGMLWSLAMQYKSVAVMMGKVSSRVLQSDPNLSPNAGFAQAFMRGLKGGNTVKNLLPMMALGTALYAGQDALIREIEGKEPRDYRDRETAMQMFAGGSGMGLWGDAVLGHASRDPKALLEFAGGPTVGQIAPLVEANGAIQKGHAAEGEQEIVNTLEGNIPGQTIPWFRHALDSLFVDHIRNSIDPEYSDKQEMKKLRRRYSVH